MSEDNESQIAEYDIHSKEIVKESQALLTEWVKYFRFDPPINWIEQLTELNAVAVTTPENAGMQCAAIMDLYGRLAEFLQVHNEVTRQLSEMMTAYSIIALAQAKLHASGVISKLNVDNLSKADWGSLYVPPEESDEPEQTEEPPERVVPKENGGYRSRL